VERLELHRAAIAGSGIANLTRTVLALRKKLTRSRQGTSIRVRPVRLAATVPTSPWPRSTSQPPRNRFPTLPMARIDAAPGLEDGAEIGQNRLLD
jgi:hypothetical protein